VNNICLTEIETGLNFSHLLYVLYKAIPYPQI